MILIQYMLWIYCNLEVASFESDAATLSDQSFSGILVSVCIIFHYIAKRILHCLECAQLNRCSVLYYWSYARTCVALGQRPRY